MNQDICKYSICVIKKQTIKIYRDIEKNRNVLSYISKRYILKPKWIVLGSFMIMNKYHSLCFKEVEIDCLKCTHIEIMEV